jgi:hypothetical protein
LPAFTRRYRTTQSGELRWNSSSPEILACHEAGITVTLPKPLTSGAKSDGRFGKQDFAYLPEEDAYRCPAGERLPYRYTNEEDGKPRRATSSGPLLWSGLVFSSINRSAQSPLR